MTDQATPPAAADFEERTFKLTALSTAGFTGFRDAAIQPGERVLYTASPQVCAKVKAIKTGTDAAGVVVCRVADPLLADSEDFAHRLADMAPLHPVQYLGVWLENTGDSPELALPYCEVHAHDGDPASRGGAALLGLVRDEVKSRFLLDPLSSQSQNVQGMMPFTGRVKRVDVQVPPGADVACTDLSAGGCSLFCSPSRGVPLDALRRLDLAGSVLGTLHRSQSLRVGLVNHGKAVECEVLVTALVLTSAATARLAKERAERLRPIPPGGS